MSSKKKIAETLELECNGECNRHTEHNLVEVMRPGLLTEVSVYACRHCKHTTSKPTRERKRRGAALLPCTGDADCGVTPHRYHGADPVHAGSGDVTFYREMYRCTGCGAKRVWGTSLTKE